VAVASAGPYASLHLAPDRYPCQYTTTVFLQAGCPSCRPDNSVKALKAQQNKTQIKWCAMEGVQVVENSQCSVAFHEQYGLQVSLEHGQRR